LTGRRRHEQQLTVHAPVAVVIRLPIEASCHGTVYTTTTWFEPPAGFLFSVACTTRWFLHRTIGTSREKLTFIKFALFMRRRQHSKHASCVWTVFTIHEHNEDARATAPSHVSLAEDITRPKCYSNSNCKPYICITYLEVPCQHSGFEQISADTSLSAVTDTRQTGLLGDARSRSPRKQTRMLCDRAQQICALAAV
jgi:hypothetical protein